MSSEDHLGSGDSNIVMAQSRVGPQQYIETNSVPFSVEVCSDDSSGDSPDDFEDAEAGEISVRFSMLSLLPREIILYHILPCLTPKTLIVLSQTSSEFRRLAISNALWGQSEFQGHIFRLPVPFDSTDLDDTSVWETFLTYRRESVDAESVLSAALSSKSVEKRCVSWTLWSLVIVLPCIAFGLGVIGLSIVAGFGATNEIFANLGFVVGGCLLVAIAGGTGVSWVVSEIRGCRIAHLNRSLTRLLRFAETEGEHRYGLLPKDVDVNTSMVERIQGVAFFGGDNLETDSAYAFCGVIQSGALLFAICPLAFALSCVVVGLRYYASIPNVGVYVFVGVFGVHELVMIFCLCKAMVSLATCRYCCRKTGDPDPLPREDVAVLSLAGCGYICVPDFCVKVCLLGMAIPLIFVADRIIPAVFAPLILVPCFCCVCCGSLYVRLLSFFICFQISWGCYGGLATMTETVQLQNAQQNRRISTCLLLITIIVCIGIVWPLSCLSFIILVSLNFTNAIRIHSFFAFLASWPFICLVVVGSIIVSALLLCQNLSVSGQQMEEIVVEERDDHSDDDDDVLKGAREEESSAVEALSQSSSSGG